MTNGTLVRGLRTCAAANAAAIAEMALENYPRCATTVLGRGIRAPQAIAMELERRFPDRFIPRYSMVMFHRKFPTPKRNAEAQSRRRSSPS